MKPVIAVFITGMFFVATLLAGNDANPDAIELVPLPQPVEFKSDIDRPVAFDETVRVTVDCPDESAAAWLDAHLKEWYGTSGVGPLEECKSADVILIFSR